MKIIKHLEIDGVERHVSVEYDYSPPEPDVNSGESVFVYGITTKDGTELINKIPEADVDQLTEDILAKHNEETYDGY